MFDYNVGGLFPRFMKEGGEPNGEMALGQMAAIVDKLSKLRKFVNEESDLDPWIASKLAVMDHSADAIYDYMAYGEDEEEEMEEEEAPMTEMELEEMRNGGIPERYRKRGFTKVGVKRKSTRPGKKWMVLAKKGNQYKIVHGGYVGMKDYTQHRNKKRQKKFWSRMGGRSSAKATDPFSPLYWHKRFGTWEDGGSIYQMGGSSQQDDVNKIIQAYSEIADVSPEQIIAELKKMDAESQQKALQQMMQAVQQAQNTGVQAPMMKMGGMPCYKCGGSKYAYGGMTNEMGGLVLPAMPMDIYGVPLYSVGGELDEIKQGGIYINPKNKGKFTAKAKKAGMGVQDFASKVLNAPEGRYSASTRRQANFARNAANWKKQDGGIQYNVPMELSQDEIDNLIAQGYNIQYLD